MCEQIKLWWDASSSNLLKNLEVKIEMLDFFGRCLRMNKQQLPSKRAKCRNIPAFSCMMIMANSFAEFAGRAQFHLPYFLV